MIQEGDMIYYEEQGQIHSGRIMNLTEETFQIENYGCCCEGNCVIHRGMIGYTFFTERAVLEERLRVMNR